MKKVIMSVLKYELYKIPSSAVLMFHHVSASPEIKMSGCLLETEKFCRVIESFSNFAPLCEVLEKPRQMKIAITFDDGLADLYTIAYPYLKKHGVPFTAFIITDFLDKPGYITTAQLKEMAEDTLVTIGSHGITHEILPALAAEEKKRELCESKRVLESIIGKPVEIFAYSHGQYDKEGLENARIYKYCMSTAGYPLNFITGHDRLRQPRFNFDEQSFDVSYEKVRKIFGR